MSYPGHSLVVVGLIPLAEMQLVYSTALANWAQIIISYLKLYNVCKQVALIKEK